MIIKTVGNKEIMKVKDSESGKFVLAYLPDKNEWVTWAADDAVEKFVMGHYFRDRDSAEIDFQKRGER